MRYLKHGLSIGINRCGEQFFLSLKAQGLLTHQDYEVITPMIDNALAAVKEPKVSVYIDGSELEGWELRAAWDDLKLGLKHGNQFEKVAIYGNKNWQQMAAKIGGWFIAGDMQYFDSEQAALSWLHDT